MNDAYRVVQGGVIVYLVPVKKGSIERRKRIAELNKGDIFPSYAYRNEAFDVWKFLVVPKSGEAELELLKKWQHQAPETEFYSQMRHPQIGRRGLPERCLEEFYLGQSLKDEGFIVHSEIAKKWYPVRQLPPLSALRNPRRKRRFRVPIPTGSLLRAARPPESRWRRRHAYRPAAARRWPFRTWQESPISPVGKWFWSRSGIVRSAVCFWALWMTRLLRCTGRKANHTSFMTGKKRSSDHCRNRRKDIPESAQHWESFAQNQTHRRKRPAPVLQKEHSKKRA